MNTVYGNEIVSVESNLKPEKINGKKYWSSYIAARANMTRENDQNVLRWVRGPGQYVTQYS